MQHNSNSGGEPTRRRKRRHHEEEHAHPVVHDESNWLVSYADMMTLLFGFFVLMYSFSKIDKDKFEVVRKDMVKYFGGELINEPGAPTGLKPLDKDLKTNLAAAFEQTSDFNTKLEGDTLILTIRSDVLFPPGSATPGEKAVNAIHKVYEAIKDRPIELIEVEGHTDADPISTAIFPSNWELSAARASSIVRLFENLQIPANKLKAAGFASSRPPTETIATVDIKQLSRRVVINLKIDPNGQNVRKQLQDQGLNIKEPGSAAAGKTKEATNEELSMQEKYDAVQARLKEAADRLAEAQAQERKAKELEALNKKTADLERKLQEVQKKTQQTLEKNNPQEAR